MNRFLWSFSLLFIMLGNLVAQNIPVDNSLRIGTLDNGMKYYIKHNAKPENKVEMRLAINVGALQEDADQLGLAHFMEHMNFNGTKNFPGNKLVDALQTIGIKFGQHLNAYTSFDETVYMLPVPLDKPGNLDLGLKVMEDWAFNALLIDEEINKERGVVLEELRLGLGPDKRMLDKYLPKMAYNSRYAERLPIGKKEILENFKPDVLRRFHKDWYRPNLMALVVVGDINVDEIEKKIKANFSKYQNPKNERERTVFTLPEHQETLVSVETDPDATRSQVQFLMKDNGVAKADITVADYNKSVVENLVSIMLNNRFQELVNSNNPPFTYGSASHGNLLRTKDAFTGFALTKDGGQIAALKVLLEEVERAKRFGFTQEELERAKSQLLSNLETSYNNRDKTESSRLIGEYVRHFLQQEAIPGIAWEYEQTKNYLPQIALAQTNEVMKGYANDNNRVIVITGPKKAEIIYPSDKEVLAVLDNAKNAKLEAYEDKAAIAHLVEPFKSKGKITKTETDAKLGTTTLTLSNGAKVTYKKTNFKEDEILFSARSLGGNSLLSDADYIKTQFAFPALAEAGVNGYSKNDLTKYLAGKQVNVAPSVGMLTEGLNGKSNQKDFETLMELVYAYFTGLNYDPASFNAFKEKQNAFLTNLVNDPNFYFQSEFQKFRNQNNPRFTNLIPLEKDWANTDYKKAYDVYKQRFANAGNFHFYFVGNIDEAKLKELATQYLASLPTTKAKTTYKDSGYRPVYGNHNKVYKKGKDPKSMVQIVYGGEAKYNEKEDLALNALGEVATIKVIEKLREDEAGIYGGGARGGMSKVPYGTYSFGISFPCGPENVDKLTKAALVELQKIIDNGPEQKDLDKYKEGELNDNKTQLKDNNYWIKNLANYQLEGGDKYEILNYEDKVKALTVKDLQAVAKKYLTKENLITATLMPEDGWEANVKKEEKNNVSATPLSEVKDLTAQQVIDNYTNALGGKQKLEAVKTIKTVANMKVQGMDLELTTLQMAPNKMKISQKMMGQDMGGTVFDGEKGYAMQMGQKMDFTAEQVKAMKDKKLFEALSLNPSDYSKVEKVSENGRNYYVLAGDKTKTYFDAETGLMYKGGSDMGDMKVLEYKTVDGIKIPSKMEISAMGQTMEMNVSEIVLNQGVSDADFK
ncbi:MAG: insulinase family protein [Cruoricaptor ignavus]|nr:insulinase family protein [Cruoricaptor ignavus]